MPDWKPSRRGALTGLGVVGLAGIGVFAARRPDRGSGGHDAYFQKISAALKAAGIAQPTLVVDRARLDANIEAVKANLAGANLPVRVVVKSLPAIHLIEAVADGLKSNRFMVFNGEMLAEMRRLRPQADLLLGKPVPVMLAGKYFDSFASLDASGRGPQWLIDTPERLAQYSALARSRGLKARVNFEIDVGLHRGGFANAAVLAQAVDLAMTDPHLEISGLMGYDPHVPKTPWPESAFAEVQRAYKAARDVLAAKLGGDLARFTLNTAGSPTYLLHAHDSYANEVSIGSAFVKPADFDLTTLVRHTPAAFIASPVLKALPRLQIPALEAFGSVMTFFDPNSERAFFMFGGHWLAVPVSPPGLQYNDLFGRSSNQELLTGSRRVELKPDDYVFLRPRQSEAVFLQFGDIAIYDQGRIAEYWPTFPVSA